MPPTHVCWSWPGKGPKGLELGLPCPTTQGKPDASSDGAGLPGTLLLGLPHLSRWTMTMEQEVGRVWASLGGLFPSIGMVKGAVGLPSFNASN